MVLSKRSHEGYLMLDHRASPGFSQEDALKLGYPTTEKLFEAPTMGCNHCGTVVLINPDRKRARAYCPACDMYICDNCEVERLQGGYVHQTYKQKAEMLRNEAILKGL